MACGCSTYSIVNTSPCNISAEVCLGNYVDIAPFGTALAITTPPTKGNVEILEGGNIRYTHTAGTLVADSFVYQYTSGEVTALCTVSVTVSQGIPVDTTVIILTATGECEVGDPTYEWELPEGVTFYPGYNKNSNPVHLIVPVYDPEEPDAFWEIKVNVCCDFCNNCCKCDHYIWNPPICTYECGLDPVCTCDDPCHQYNPLTGNCDGCPPGQQCCNLGEGNYACQECCTNDDCPSGLCVAGVCQCDTCTGYQDPLPNGQCPCIEECLNDCEYCDPTTNTVQIFIPECGPLEIINSTTNPCSCQCIACQDPAGNCIPCPCTAPEGSRITVWDNNLQEMVAYTDECPDCQNCILVEGTYICVPIFCEAYGESWININPPYTGGDITGPTGVLCTEETPCCCIEDPCPDYSGIEPIIIDNDLRIRKYGACSTTSSMFEAYFVSTPGTWINSASVVWEINFTNYTGGWEPLITDVNGRITTDLTVYGEGFLIRATYKGRTWTVEYWNDNCNEPEVREVFPSCIQIIKLNAEVAVTDITVTNDCDVTILYQDSAEVVFLPSDTATENCLCVSYDFIHPGTGVVCNNVEKCFTPTPCTGPCDSPLSVNIDVTINSEGYFVYHASVITAEGNTVMYTCELPETSEWAAAVVQPPVGTGIQNPNIYNALAQDNCGTLPNSGFATDFCVGGGVFNCTGDNLAVPTLPCGWVVEDVKIHFLQGSNLIIERLSANSKVCFGVNTICGYVCSCTVITPPDDFCTSGMSTVYSCAAGEELFTATTTLTGTGLIGAPYEIWTKVNSGSPWVQVITGIVNSLVINYTSVTTPYAVRFVVGSTKGCPIMEDIIYPECSAPGCPPSFITSSFDCNSDYLNVILSGGIVSTGGIMTIQIFSSGILVFTQTVTVVAGQSVYSIPIAYPIPDNTVQQIVVSVEPTGECEGISSSPLSVLCGVPGCDNDLEVVLDCEAPDLVIDATGQIPLSYIITAYSPVGVVLYTQTIPGVLHATFDVSALLAAGYYTVVALYASCRQIEQIVDNDCNISILCTSFPEIDIDYTCGDTIQWTITGGIGRTKRTEKRDSTGDAFTLYFADSIIASDPSSGSTFFNDIPVGGQVRITILATAECPAIVETITRIECGGEPEFCQDITGVGSITIPDNDVGGKSIYQPDWSDGDTPQIID